MRANHRLTCLTLVICAGACMRHDPITTTLRSPSGTFAVSLKGSTGRSMFPWITLMLTGSASAAGDVLCSDFELHRADSFDTAFAGRYPSSEWPRDNVLRFKRYWDVGGDATDELVCTKPERSDISVPRCAGI